MKPLVVITDSNLPSDELEERVLRPAGFDVVRADCRTEDDVIRAASPATALIVQWAPISEHVLESLERCRFVSRLGIGCDMIDLAAAARLGIAVANTPDYCLEEVAAHTIALALAASRGLLALDRSVRASEWSVTAHAPVVARPSAACFAVLGFGRIGKRVAAVARSLGYQVVVYDPYLDEAEVLRHGCRAASFEAALAEAAIVSLHMPLSAETDHLIDARALELMRETGVLINTSRGGLVDQEALANALFEGSIAGAGIDVFETEPLPADSPLRNAPNLVLTPHAAWYSSEALDDLPLQAAQHVVDFFAGLGPASIVNPEYTHGAAQPARNGVAR